VGCVGVVTASTAGHCKSNLGRSTIDDADNFYKGENKSDDFIVNISNNHYARSRKYESEIQVIYGKYLLLNFIFVQLPPI
jgi:hypothetical protein